MIVPISEAAQEYAAEVRTRLRLEHIHVDCDNSDRKMQKKVGLSGMNQPYHTHPLRSLTSQSIIRETHTIRELHMAYSKGQGTGVSRPKCQAHGWGHSFLGCLTSITLSMMMIMQPAASTRHLHVCDLFCKCAQHVHKPLGLDCADQPTHQAHACLRSAIMRQAQPHG